MRIAACGAEMTSITQKGTGDRVGLERLWCRDPAVWKRHAPILFPLIGRLREGFYLLGDRRIDAPTHGFCRDRVFEAVQLSRAVRSRLRMTSRRAACIRSRSRFPSSTPWRGTRL